MRPHKPDYLLLAVIVVLLVLGTFTLFNASSVRGEIVQQDPFFYLKRQTIYLFLGLAAFFVLSRINHQFLKKVAFLVIIWGFLLMLLVFVPGIGVTLKGATRWVQIGPFSFQPVEFFKLSLVIYLASFFSARQGQLNRFSETIMPFLVIQGAIVLVMLGQKSLGSLVLLLLISLAVFFLAGLDFKYLFVFVGLFFVLGIAAIFFEPYRFERIKTFFDPSVDPLGKGYQINQALISIGSGGLRGVGFGHSRQKFYFLPETMSDSIFAIWAEETGFIGTSLLLVLIGLFFWQGFAIARNSAEMFSKLLAGGITFWISVQFLFNIAANTNLIPLSGIPLPFFSYGGSALLSTLMASGILINISRYTVKRR